MANPVWPRLKFAFRRLLSTSPLQKSVTARLVRELWGVDCHLGLGHATTIPHEALPTGVPVGMASETEYLYMNRCQIVW